MKEQTDRQLLELAAKAAGILIDKSPYNGGGSCNDGFDLLGNAVLDWHNGEKWNPLTDDGDAFRLAATLGLMIDFSIPGRIQCAGEYGLNLEEYYIASVTVEKTAAARYAIVRAAAAIGRAQP